MAWAGAINPDTLGASRRLPVEFDGLMLGANPSCVTLREDGCFTTESTGKLVGGERSAFPFGISWLH
jgi:hypothetical protein